MTDNHDFKGALEGHKRAKENGDLTTWFSCYEKTFIKSLRLADILQSGEVSEEVRYRINRAFDLHPTDNRSVDFAFKAMAQQMIKEESE